MRRLPEVEEAKTLMTEAAAWSVMKWLREKKRVRKVADNANAALDALDRQVKAGWNSETTSAYNELTQTAGSTSSKQSSAAASQPTNSKIREFVRQVREADDQAYQARMDAERTFDDAERILSTSLAREGCRKAILSWDLHEKAIRRAEAT